MVVFFWVLNLESYLVLRQSDAIECAQRFTHLYKRIERLDTPLFKVGLGLEDDPVQSIGAQISTEFLLIPGPAWW
jgi:hypothetical protein